MATTTDNSKMDDKSSDSLVDISFILVDTALLTFSFLFDDRRKGMLSKGCNEKDKLGTAIPATIH